MEATARQHNINANLISTAISDPDRTAEIVTQFRVV
jgi:hypothetical protein